MLATAYKLLSTEPIVRKLSLRILLETGVRIFASWNRYVAYGKQPETSGRFTAAHESAPIEALWQARARRAVTKAPGFDVF
jgi:hypothetical protein